MMILRSISNIRSKVYKDVSTDSYVHIGVLLFIFLLASVSLHRQFLSYGVETDFLAHFVPEASRFLNQEPLRVEFHPPFYSITLALFYSVVGDWFISGLIISLLSALIVMVTTYHFFKLKFGKLEAIGAILALAFSWVFISYSMQASSDIFFWALFFIALATAAHAVIEDRAYIWVISGAVVGLAVITRTNGIALFSYLIIPVLSTSTKMTTKKRLICSLAGILIPTMAWVALSTIYRSPVLPQYNFQNLAANYFSDDRKNAGNVDVFIPASKGFASTWQVLTKDPKKIFKLYLKDLYQNTKRLFSASDLLPFPYIQLALPGLILIFFVKFDRFKFGVMIVLLCMFLLTNFHSWMNRSHLFVVPFLGAGSIALLSHFHKLLSRNILVTLLVLFVSTSVLVFSANVGRGYIGLFKEAAASDAAAASQTILKRKLSSEPIVFARKPHLGYYAMAKEVPFPLVDTIEDLKKSVENEMIHHPNHPTAYLFYGRSEKLYRPDLIDLASPGFSAPWLQKIERGSENGGWVLYEIIRDKF